MTQELEQLINDGLFYYEQELWQQDSQGVKAYNFVHFEKINIWFHYFFNKRNIFVIIVYLIFYWKLQNG